MTKKDIITKISEKTELTKKDSEAALNAFIETITNSLATGDKIQMAGFGIFEVTERAARTGRNPHDGSTIKIPARKLPKFKPSKTLKDMVNGGK